MKWFSDDLRLMSGFNGTGEGSGDSTRLDPGNFGILFNDTVLDPSGELYFTSPRPFYVGFEANGNFNPFQSRTRRHYITARSREFIFLR